VGQPLALLATWASTTRTSASLADASGGEAHASTGARAVAAGTADVYSSRADHGLHFDDVAQAAGGVARLAMRATRLVIEHNSTS